MPRKGDGLYQRNGSPYWWFRYRDETGWRSRSTEKKTRAEAHRAKHAFLQAMSDGKLPTDMADWPLERAVGDWLEYKRVANRPGSLPAQKTIAKHLVEYFGQRKLGSLRKSDLWQYIKARREHVGPKTVNNELATLFGVLRPREPSIAVPGGRLQTEGATLASRTSVDGNGSAEAPPNSGRKPELVRCTLGCASRRAHRVPSL
jgi:hypothetical protein